MTSSTISSTPLVEVPDELRGALLNAARLQFEFAATGHVVFASDEADNRQKYIDDLASHHRVCVALETGEVGDGMFPADVVKTAAEWALDDVECRFRDDSGWTIDAAADAVERGRKLRTLIETCER